MKIEFYKYHGTGNDFVMIDNREGRIKLSQKQVNNICTRRFGVGADGLILLENQSGYDFKMTYYNSDGNLSTMCGNGGRCLVQFARDLNVIKNSAKFIAIDGDHEAVVVNNGVELKMMDTLLAIEKDHGFFLDTGSPHHVLKVENAKKAQVFSEGKRLRNEVYGSEGANINFVETVNDHSIFVRTYERGVEDETFSCGTGVTAAAIVASQKGWVQPGEVNIKTLGGELRVSFEKGKNGFSNVWLKGPAVQVFKGILEL